MILGNKFLRCDKTLGFQSARILEMIKRNGGASLSEISYEFKISTIDCIYCLDFLFIIGSVDIEGDKICLVK